MSRKRLLALALLIALGGSARAYEYVLSSGAPGGVYDRLGRAIQKVVGGRDVNLSIQTGTGSVGNVERLVAGEAHLALVQSDILLAAQQGEAGFAKKVDAIRPVAKLYEEVLHVVASAASGISSLDGCRGKRLWIGAAGSGTAGTARRVLEAHGVKAADLAPVAEDPGDVAAALAAGKIDGFFHVSAPRAPVVLAALKAGARLVPVDPAKVEPLEAGGAVERAEIFPDQYEGAFTEAVPAVAVRALLCARADVPADVVYEVLARLFTEEGLKTLGQAHETVGELTLEEAQAVPQPAHPGADRFYYEHDRAERPVRVHVGIFVKEIYDFDLKTQRFSVVGGIWFRWRGKLEQDEPEFRFHLANGTFQKKALAATERFGGWTYHFYDIIADLRGTFLLHKFPFDTHTIRIQVEHDALSAQDMVFVADENLDGTPRDLMAAVASKTVGDWQVASVVQAASVSSTKGSLGNPVVTREARTAPRYTLEITVHRVLLPYLLKFSIPLVLTGLLSYAIFLIDIRAYDTKIFVMIWVLFTAVEFHTLQSESLPEVGYLVTGDKFFLSSYFAICLVLVHILIVDRLKHQGREAEVNRLMWGALIFYPVLFFGPIALLIWTSL